jgi:hypothetical protein
MVISMFSDFSPWGWFPGSENYKLQNTKYKQITNYKIQITKKTAHELHELTRISKKKKTTITKTKGSHGLPPGRISMQTMTAFGSFKVRRLKRRLKASIPGMQATYHLLHNIRHFDAFSSGEIHLKKPSVGPKGLIGPPCHGVPGRRRRK